MVVRVPVVVSGVETAVAEAPETEERSVSQRRRAENIYGKASPRPANQDARKTPAPKGVVELLGRAFFERSHR